MQLVERALRQGRVDLSKESAEALLKDYEKFKNNKIVGPVVIEEIFKRTGNTVTPTMLEGKYGYTLVLYPDYWRLSGGEYDPGFNMPYPIDKNSLWILKPTDYQKTLIELYHLRAKITSAEKKIREVREKVKQHPEERRSLFSEFHSAMKELERLNPFDSELDYGILGKPFFVGLADQG